MTASRSSDSTTVPDKTFGQHLWATLILGVPLVLAQITQMLINVTDTLMLGWLGVTELAAGTLAFQTLFIVLIFGLGFAAALMPLVASAMGRNDPQSVRRSTRMALWVLIITVVLFMVPLLFSKQLLLALGQKPETVDLAARYLIIAQWSLIPAFLQIGLRNFLASLELTRAILIISIATMLLNALLNYMLIFGNFGAPRLEMEGAAIATVLANTAAFLALALYVKFSALTRPYAIFQRFWRPEWPAFREIIRVGLPIAITIFAEAGLFSAASLMIGSIGTIPLAAHGIALQWASLSFMVPLGLSQAASVRVGNAAGRRDSKGIGLAANTALVMSVGFACLPALVFWLVPEPLIRMFLDFDKPNALDVLAYAVPLLAVAAAFQIFDTLQVASAGNLRGLKDTKVPMIIAAISYWPIGMGTAYLLAFPLGWGGVGIWTGLVVGLCVASIALTWRFANRKRLGLVEAA